MCKVELVRLGISVSIIMASAVIHAADSYDADVVDQEDDVIELSERESEEFQFSDGLLLDGIDGIVSENVYEQKQLFGGDRQFIYQHDYSYILFDSSETATNRSSLRFIWNRVFGDLVNSHIDVKPLLYFGGDNHRAETDELIDSELTIKELYLQASLGNTSITLGDKIVIWGESESGAVTDVISPQNLTELVFTSLDESRISQTMMLVSQYINQNQLTLIVNPDIKFNQAPPDGDSPEGVEVIGDQYDKDKVELGFRWKSAIGNGDFSIMVADLIDNRSVLQITDMATESVRAVNFYKNYQMFGAAANLNYGDIALQIESAYNKDRAQQASYGSIVEGIHEEGFIISDEVKTSFTLKYQENGLRDWEFGVINTYYSEDADNFSVSEKVLNELIFSVSRKYLHETLTVQMEAQYEIQTDANIQRLAAIYAASDNLNISIDIFNLNNIGTSDFEQSSFITRLIYSF